MSNKSVIPVFIITLLLILSAFYPVFAQKKSDFVRLFIGTGGDNGQVDPAACIPYGMIRVCPDSDPRSHVGYDYDVTKISGFSINRISGIGCSGAGGNISIKPSLKETELHVDKNYEMAIPGYYITSLDNGVKAEFTATNNVAFEQFHFPIWKEAFMSINFASSFTKVLDVKYEIISNNEIQGHIQAGNTCDHGAYKIYFNIIIDRSFKVKTKSEQEIELSFGSDALKPIDVRVAISSINAETAKKENEKVKKLTFEQVKKQAGDAWENILSRIEIKEGSEEDIVQFYTSLYRVFLSPANVTSLDNKFMGTDGNIYPVGDFNYYSSWSMWDTYRTKFPLITLLDTKSMRDFANSLCNLYVYGKKDWATEFESTPTVRTEHTIAVLLDAYKKGIPNIRLKEAYNGIKKEMNNLPASRPDQVLETCFDWWAMAELAKALDETEDASFYAEKSKKTFIESWNKDFKTVDSTFSKMKDNGLYQGTRWQYRWALPQYLNDMSESLGKDVLINELDYYFANNLFNQSNEVGLHAPYLFNRLGEYEKAQKNIRRIINEELHHRYGGNAEYPTPHIGKPYKLSTLGFMPEMDEDDGTMGAWYVFSTLGLYPLIVGDPWYEITSPFFDAVTIKLDNGKKINIKTKNRKSPDDVIKQVTFNKTLLSDFRINHNELIKGGTLELEY